MGLMIKPNSVPVAAVVILATSGKERCELLVNVAAAKLQLFQGQESINGSSY